MESYSLNIRLGGGANFLTLRILSLSGFAWQMMFLICLNMGNKILDENTGYFSRIQWTDFKVSL